MMQLWHDRTLRLISVLALLFGVFAASFAPYVSLLGITIFGLSDPMFALQMTATLLVSVVTSVGIGILTDRHPLRRLFALIAMGASCAALLLVWLWGSTSAFLIAHTLIFPLGGTIFGQLFAVMRLYTTHLPADTRDALTATIRALFAVPFIVVLPLWGWAFDAGVPLVTLYPAVLVVMLVMSALIYFAWPADADAPWGEEKSTLTFMQSVQEVLASNIVWRLFWMGAIHAGSTLMGVLLALVFDAANGRGAGDVGLFFGSFVALEVAVMFAVSPLLRYVRRLHIIAIGAVFYAVFLGLLPVLAPYGAVWLLIVPAAVGGGLLYGLSITYLQDLLGARAGAGASLVTLQRLVSEGLAAVIFAIGTWLGGYHIVAFMGAVVIVLGAVSLLWIDRRNS